MIRARVFNVDGMLTEHEWENIDELKEAWYDDDYSGPSLDDKLAYGEIDGCGVDGETFDDFMKRIEEKYGWEY